MMSGFDISMYREMFLEEAEELFESADNVLLEAENNGSLTDDEMGQLFRDVHTLKGSGASVELTYFAEFTHDVENMMDKLRNHAIEYKAEMAETLIDGLDVMKEILQMEVDEEITRENFTEMTSELLVKIRAYINGEDVSPVSSPVVPAEVVQTTPEVINNTTEITNISEEDKMSRAYGFFADEAVTDISDSSDSYGFFDSTQSDIPLENKVESTSDENFGFFDDSESITPDSKIETAEVSSVPVPTTKEVPVAEIKATPTAPTSAPATKTSVPAKGKTATKKTSSN